jgi:DNA polymerase (family 10)
MDHFGKWKQFESQTGRGPTKMSIRTAKGLQIDLRVVPAESFGAALQYFTGSKEHNVEVRKIAKKRGLKINEYGVFDEEDKPVPGAGVSEEAVYKTIGMKVAPPELRENRREIEWATTGKLPDLITADSIQGDLHMHTTATDGRNSIEEMAAAARKRGLKYIAITDHSKRVTMARGLDSDRLLAQWAEIDQINKQSDDGFLILKGIECDILEAGGMDLPDETLAQADWVIASLHYGQTQPRQQITDRIVGALQNPHVWIVAHPTGRLIGRRGGYDVDLGAVFQAASENKKFLELNASPSRLDLDDVNLMAARLHDIPIVISTDAHQTEGLDDLRYGILQARRAALTASDVANTRTWPELKKLVGRA